MILLSLIIISTYRHLVTPRGRDVSLCHCMAHAVGHDDHESLVKAEISLHFPETPVVITNGLLEYITSWVHMPLCGKSRGWVRCEWTRP